MRFMVGFFVFTVLASGVVGGGFARADSATVVVRPFSGPGSGRVRAAIIAALQERSVGFVATDDVDQAAERLGVDPGDATGRVAISRELGISTWVVGSVEKDGRFFVANVEILNGADGESMGLMNFEGRRPVQVARTARDRLWADASDLILAGRVPQAMPEVELPPEPGGDELEPRPGRASDLRDDLDEEDYEDEGEGSGGPSPLAVQVGMVGFSRSFSYNDDLTGLRSYDLGMAPAIGVRVHWYPLAHGGEENAASHIGLDLRGRFAFGVDSALDDTTFPTSARELGVGIRGRLPLGASELGAVIGYGHQVFRISSVEDEERGRVLPGIPRATYSMLRVGADARFALGEQWAIALAAGLLPTFSTGQLEEWFPNASAIGFEGELAVIHRLSSSFELKVGAGLQRFGYSLEPELEDVGESPIAGGALDQYVSGELALRWVM